MKHVAIICCLLALNAISKAQSLPQQRVSVVVSCKDERTKEQMASYIKRELRAFSDVVVVEEDADLTISIIGLAQHTQDGEHIGFAIAGVVHGTSGRAISQSLKRRHACKNDPALDELDRLVIIRHQFILSDGIDNLNNLCKRAVTSIDTRVFEPDRKTFQYLDDRFKERQKRP